MKKILLFIPVFFTLIFFPVKIYANGASQLELTCFGNEECMKRECDTGLISKEDYPIEYDKYCKKSLAEHIKSPGNTFLLISVAALLTMITIVIITVKSYLKDKGQK